MKRRWWIRQTNRMTPLLYEASHIVHGQLHFLLADMYDQKWHSQRCSAMFSRLETCGMHDFDNILDMSKNFVHKLSHILSNMRKKFLWKNIATARGGGILFVIHLKLCEEKDRMPLNGWVLNLLSCLVWI